jgi:hypothetical protein
MFWRRRKSTTRQAKQDQPQAKQGQPRTQPLPQPRGGDAELARSRELLVTTRGALSREIEWQALYEHPWTAKVPGTIYYWRGAERLYEEIGEQMLDGSSRRHTPGYVFRRAAEGFEDDKLEMTVSADGQVELSGAWGGSAIACPATAEGLRASLNVPEELDHSRKLLAAARTILSEEIGHRALAQPTGTRHAPGMIDPWWGPQRLYEETYQAPQDWDRPEWGNTEKRRTPGYFFGIPAPSHSWRAYVKMTVNSEGRVELTGPNSLDPRPATVEELKDLLSQ